MTDDELWLARTDQAGRERVRPQTYDVLTASAQDDSDTARDDLTPPDPAEEGSLPAGVPLAAAQKRIWSLGQIGNGTVFPAQVLALKLSVFVDDGVVGALARRHPALRARFRRFAGGRIEHYVAASFDLPVEALDPASEMDDALAAALETFAARPFDLDADPAARVARAPLAQGGCLLAIVLHPIVCDPASLRILTRDLLACLDGRLAEGVVQDAAIAYAAAEQAWLRSAALEERLAYWRGVFAEDYASTTLPTRQGLGAGASGLRRRRLMHIDEELNVRLRRLAKSADVTPPVILLTGFLTLLARYGGMWSLRIGVVVENREDDLAAAVGRIEDVAPLVLALSPRLRFAQAAQRVQTRLDEAVAHRVPIERLAQALWRPEKNANESLVKTLFEHRPPILEAGETAAPVPLPFSCRGDADFILSLTPDPAGGLVGVLDFADGLYDDALAARAADHFKRILAAAADDHGVRLCDILLVAAEELDALSAPHEDTAVDDDRPVHELIRDHARRAPDKVAIICGDERWTFGRLEEHANRLAHRLMREGVGREDCVAVAVRRSPEAIAVMLAVLKAGGAYIPVEPDHPPARNDHILRDAGVKAIVTESRLIGRIPADVDAAILALDRLDLGAEPSTPPNLTVYPNQLAYVMYTSGSTGRPKGVAVEHGPLTHHLQATARVYGMTEASRELPFLPFSSDGGHERWMNPLMVGGSIVLPDGPLWTPEETLSAMRRHGANNASIPTTYLQQLAEWADATDGAPPMRLYSFGGEGLPQSTFELLSRALKSEWLINGYGPTETIMTPMVWKVLAGTRFEGAYAPLGRSVGRRRAYVLDPDFIPCPIGVTGELYLGGDGVARGYVGRPGVTADRFMPDPFGAPGARLYRTGDMARWREDGTTEFVGRVDLQVKLRGFRIELGEIEAALLAQAGVGESLVILREDPGGKALVGYVTPQGGANLDGDELRRALAHELPDYMVPAAIVTLERMPTNPSSKLDRAALPAPTLRAMKAEPAATELEREILALWSQALGFDAFGVTDNFFDIGGHSLAAVRVIGLYKQVNPKAQITIADLFNNPTVRRLAASIERGGEAVGGQVIRLRETGSRPMLYCFPGLLVSTREYVKLVDFLGPEQPATGFICYSLSDDKKLDASVEEIAGRYVDHIRKESRGRPCFFLGWSWGGLLAYETARMLGSDIDLRQIGMIDVCDLGTEFAIGATPRFESGERDELQRLVWNWLDRTRMRADWDRLLGSMDAATYDQFLRFVGDEEESLPTDGPDISSREHTFWILIDNALIFRRHTMKPYDCPIHSWAAEDSLHRGLNLLDWRRLSRRANPSEIIAGTNHLYVIGSSAFHSRLAHRLDEAMAETV